VIVVEPYAVSAAIPTAMPIIRATVTVAEAAPKAARPAASTAAVERGVTVSPNPKPKTAAEAANHSVWTSGLQDDIQTRPPVLIASPISVHPGGGTSRRVRKPEMQRAHGHRPGQRPEDHALRVGPAVQNPVDEDCPADDCRGHAVAGQQRDQRRRAEHAVGEQPRIEERIRAAQTVDDGQQPRLKTPAAMSAPTASSDRHAEDLAPVPMSVMPNRIPPAPA
jgi:hypothetical protein